jgi:hypothetical protein
MTMQLAAERLFDLPTLPTGWELAATGVGPDFAVLIVAADASFDERRAGRSSRYRLYKRVGESFDSFEFVVGRRAAYTYVQPIGDRGNQFLLVTPSLYEGMDNNGDIWSSDGTLVRQLSLGEGIEHVQTSVRSDVWVGYNDEGIYTAGEPGLTCFDVDGKRVFSFADAVANDDDVPFIDDCYALNVVSDNEVWLYYYSDFPLVRLVDKRLAGIWPRTPGVGAHAFAIAERSVLFAGDYGDRSSITRYFPESGRIEAAHAIGDGMPLEFRRAIGRGDRLYLLTDSAIWLLQPD